MSRPTGQHLELLPGLPRHYPSCTAAGGAEEGCWCSVRYYQGDPTPDARAYRRVRRCVRRHRRRWTLELKRHGMPPQHDLFFNHYWTPDGRTLCEDGCPAKGFDFARDWPPTVTSWKGLTR